MLAFFGPLEPALLCSALAQMDGRFRAARMRPRASIRVIGGPAEPSKLEMDES
jgi:hypothetical protein